MDEEKRQAPIRRDERKSAHPLLLLAILLAVVSVIGFAGWKLLSPGGSVQEVASTPPTATKSIPEPAKEPVAPAAVAEITRNDAPKTTSDNFDAQMNALHTAMRNKRAKGDPVGPTHPLHGRVVEEGTGTPVYFFSIYLNPVEEGDVRASRGAAEPNRFRNGEFTLEHQGAGHYNLLCESPQFEDKVVENVEIPHSGDLRIELSHGAYICGHVRDVNATPLKDMELQIEPISILDGRDPPTQRITRSDGNGSYSFWKLPPGDYALKVGLFGDTQESVPQFHVGAGEKVEHDFILQRKNTLRVVVTNVANQPVARARVTLLQSQQDGRERFVRTVYTDLKGVAPLEFMSEGGYKLRVQMAGFRMLEQPLQISDGDGTRDLPVTLEIEKR